MAKRVNTNKARLNRRWQQVCNALIELANLHTWPKDRDIAQVEGELLSELDAIEYQLGRDLYDRA